MALFQFRWLRRLIRRHTTPIPEDKAALWKKRFSIAYMFITWNALGCIIYLYLTGKGDISQYYGLKTEEEINKPPAEYYAELLGIKKAHVIRFKSFQKVKEYDYEAKEED